MTMVKTFSFFLALTKTSIRASVSLRGAFLLESFLMISNNLIFFSIWWVFFLQFNDIAGWKIQEMTALMAIGLGAYGTMLIFFGGIKPLSRMIISGDLDPFMTQPKNLLLHVIGSKSTSKGWGHLMTTAILLILGKIVTVKTLPLIALSILTGAVVFSAIGIIAHSMAFWLGATESVSRKYCDSLFLFALYPTNIYSGFLQCVMFTLIPAGIIGYLPVELLRAFTWLKLIVLLLCAFLFFALAFFIFYLGLRRYESGNQFGVRS